MVINSFGSSKWVTPTRITKLAARESQVRHIAYGIVTCRRLLKKIAQPGAGGNWHDKIELAQVMSALGHGRKMMII